MSNPHRRSRAMDEVVGIPSSGRVPAAPGSSPCGTEAGSRLRPSGNDPSRDDDPYWDYEENECANCGGEGFTYGCSWDWLCDTYDEGEGTCLCTRRCDWCSPRKPDPELRAVLAEALDAQGIEARRAETPESGSVHESPVGNADAPNPSSPSHNGEAG